MLTAWALMVALPAMAQRSAPPDAPTRLLTDIQMQVDATEALNQMYNFKFEQAEKQFRWIQQEFPEHPLPYFLMALGTWWKIMPDASNEAYDDTFLEYLELSISKAEAMLDRGESPVEAHFFLSGAYGFMGRLHSDRRNWRKATLAGRASLKHLEACQGNEFLTPELLFGDALYNYYAEWVRENYALLRPVMAFFPDGDKEKGLSQLDEVSRQAFFTRIEAQVFLMRIYAGEENRVDKALPIAKYLHEQFPDNAYFHRYYARFNFSLGRMNEVERASEDILRKIETGYPGYEATSGRYAGFFLGHIRYHHQHNPAAAAEAFRQAVAFGEQSGDTEAGYYLHSLAYLGRIAEDGGYYDLARDYYRKLKRRADRDHRTYEEAVAFLKRYRDLN